MIIKFEWEKSQQEMLTELGLNAGGRVQLAIDSAVVKFNAKYHPFQTGTSSQSFRGVGTGRIEYYQPYEQYLYYGKLMVAPNGSAWAKLGEKKHLTNIDLKYNGAPTRGAFWFERMKANHVQDIIKEAQNAV